MSVVWLCNNVHLPVRVCLRACACVRVLACVLACVRVRVCLRACACVRVRAQETFEDYFKTPEGGVPQRHMMSFLNPMVDYLVHCRPLSYGMSFVIRYLKRIIYEKMSADMNHTEVCACLCVSE